MWWLILGAIILAGVKITINIIMNKIKDYIWNKFIDLIGSTIKAKIEEKNYNSVIVGIYDMLGLKIDRVKIEGESVSDDVKEGQVLTIDV